jgi:hypothetical protein
VPYLYFSVLSHILKIVIFSGSLLLRPKLPLIKGVTNKSDSFPKDFAMVSGAKLVQGVANVNGITLEGLVYTSSERLIFI